MEGAERGLENDRILTTLVCGFFFSLRDDQGKALASDESFEKELTEKGFKIMLREVSGIKDEDLISRAEEIYDRLTGRTQTVTLDLGRENGREIQIQP